MPTNCQCNMTRWQFCVYCKQPTHASPGDDDALPPYQEDLLTQYGVDPVAASQGHWSPYSVSTTPAGKTWTRTFTAPDGTVITEVSSSGRHSDGLWPSFLVVVIAVAQFTLWPLLYTLWPSLFTVLPSMSWFVAFIAVALLQVVLSSLKLSSQVRQKLLKQLWCVSKMFYCCFTCWFNQSQRLCKRTE